jgi:uncharacterized protein (DUF1800 family)
MAFERRGFAPFGRRETHRYEQFQSEVGEVTLEAASRDEIARLFGRAAFGATGAELDQWTGRPYAEAVNSLVDIPPPGDRGSQVDDTRRVALVQTGGQSQDRTQAQRWWLERMRTTKYPLEERMTLLWHGHFATATRYPYPDVAMALVQNEMLRRNALGNFVTLVREVTLDPAMMEWLDGSRNSIPAPNENYARELLELFTLGKYPQVFSEADVREAARVLTGWATNPGLRSVAFNAAGHDTGAKTVLGVTFGDEGDREYAHLIDVALAQPVSARFVAAKMVANFAYAPDMTNLLTKPDPLVAKVAAALTASNWDIRSAMRTLLLADEFRTGDAGAQRLLVRQPVELVVASAKAFGVSLENADAVLLLREMGQELFLPPNVGGFPSGLAWLSPTTVLARYGWATAVNGMKPAALPASGDLDGWARRLGLAGFTAETAAAVRKFVAESNKPEDLKQAGVLILLLASADWAVI